MTAAGGRSTAISAAITASPGGIAGLNGDGSYNGNFANVTAMAGWQGLVYSWRPKGRQILSAAISAGWTANTRGGFAGFNPDGSLDTSFKGAVDGTVRSVAIQADGKILLAGYFGQCQGYSRTSLARLNPDGSLDTAFKPLLVSRGNYVNEVRQVLPLSTGKLMIAGWLQDSSSWDYYPVARLNSDGSKDSSFDASGFTIRGSTQGHFI